MSAMAGLSFVYVALPVSMAVYLFLPPYWRPGGLLALSLAYYFAVFPRLALYMVGLAALDLAALEVMRRWDKNTLIRKYCLAFSAVKNLGCIALFSALLRDGQLAPEALLGLYVVTLSGLGCVLEMYRRQIPGHCSRLHFALYCFYFPRLAAGPLLPYREFAPQLESPNPGFGEIMQGLGLFVQGAVKFAVLGEHLLLVYTDMRLIPPGEASVLGVWATVATLALNVYFRFSGCADMARGIGRMMGIDLPENFRRPFLARSVTDFLGRFNSTFTRYVRQALGGRFSEGIASVVGLLIIGGASGLWFGFSVGRFAWGIFLGVFLVLERYAYPSLLDKLPAPVGRLCTLIIILFGFALFDAATLQQGFQNAIRMLGLDGSPLWSDRLGYLLESNRLLLTASLLFATGGAGAMSELLRGWLPPLAYNALCAAVVAALLALLTTFAI